MGLRSDGAEDGIALIQIGNPAVHYPSDAQSHDGRVDGHRAMKALLGIQHRSDERIDGKVLRRQEHLALAELRQVLFDDLEIRLLGLALRA